jgi:hypothetical protein
VSGRQHHRGGLGFGGAVGLGVALALLIGVIAIGHAIFGQITEAFRVVLIFLEVAACTVLTLVLLMLCGLLAYRGQLARYHLARERLALEAQARQLGTVRAEVIPSAAAAEALEGRAEALRPTLERPAILGRRPRAVIGRHLEAVPEPGDGEGA